MSSNAIKEPFFSYSTCPHFNTYTDKRPRVSIPDSILLKCLSNQKDIKPPCLPCSESYKDKASSLLRSNSIEPYFDSGKQTIKNRTKSLGNTNTNTNDDDYTKLMISDNFKNNNFDYKQFINSGNENAIASDDENGIESDDENEDIESDFNYHVKSISFVINKNQLLKPPKPRINSINSNHTIDFDIDNHHDIDKQYHYSSNINDLNIDDCNKPPPLCKDSNKNNDFIDDYESNYIDYMNKSNLPMCLTNIRSRRTSSTTLAPPLIHNDNFKAFDVFESFTENKGIRDDFDSLVSNDFLI